jgi:hypothetical protein
MAMVYMMSPYPEDGGIADRSSAGEGGCSQVVRSFYPFEFISGATGDLSNVVLSRSSGSTGMREFASTGCEFIHPDSI